MRTERIQNTTARVGILALLVLCLLPFMENAQAQTTAADSGRLTTVKSRAEQQAEQQVALSPEKIIELLQQEPGLLLVSKRMLVRKAYEQGRILDPEDLTDEALFQLLREDHNICVLVTHEIEDRSYIKAKPTEEQIERERERNARYGAAQLAATASDSVPSGGGQEQAYWKKHAEADQQYAAPNNRPNQVGPNAPDFQSPAPPANPARQMQMTSLAPNQEMYDGMATDAIGAGGNMSRISPEQLPSLLSTSAASGTSFASLDGAASLRGRQPVSPLGGYGVNSASPFSSSGGQQGGTDFYSRSTDFNLQGNLAASRPHIPSPEDLNLDRPQVRHKVDPYANVPSLYDLYSQVSTRPAMLERFGTNIFRNGTGNIDKLPMDLPAGPDYVLGPGDGVSIEIWGGVAQRLHQVVDPSGRLALPEVGTVQVSGRTLGDVQRLVQAALRTQFHDVEADVSLSRIRSVRVYVVGEVENPGPYDISSLSTVLNALYAAGGPTSRGSLRHLRLYRGKELVQEIDAYDLLLHGVHNDLARIQSGDTIQVPPMGAEVTVDGMVMHPAIYELRDETSLAQALELAGGVLRSGTFRHIEVERVVAHQTHTMLQLNMPETNDEQAISKALDEFKIQDGDKIRIWPILPYSEKTVYLDGHVFHPGKYAYHDAMKVTDLIHSYNDLLPEPYRRHAEVIRLEPPDYTPTVIAFNLEDALAGKDQDLTLKPFDTVRVYGRYDFEDAPVVTVSGEVRDPGDHATNGVMRLRDAVY
ncbi:MAG TPA: SLBB domain-containing protein, partial [Terriglobales bacterium]